MAMTLLQARDRLNAMLANDDDVLALTSDQIQELLDISRLVDSEGRSPNDEGYVPVWDFNHAAYRGWLLKAGLAAAKISFSSEGARFDRDQYMKHCEVMVKFYGRHLAGSVRLG